VRAISAISLFLSLILVPAVSPAQSGGNVAELFPELQGTMQTSLPFTLSDGAGYTWDIQYDGSISDGVNDAFDGSMSVDVNGSFASFNGFGNILEGGREIALPMTTTGGGLMIARRVLVAPDDGYARFVEVLYNPSSSAMSASVTHHFSLGSDDSTQVVTTTDGDTVVSGDDRSWVTDDATPTGDDPAIAVLFGDDGAEGPIQASLMPGSDTPTVRYQAEVPAGDAVAVVLFVAQRNNRDEASSWVSSFDAGAALGDLPYALVNFSGGGRGPTFRVSGLLRGSERDVVELRDGNRLEGDLQDKKWDIETPYGTHEIKLKTVAGVIAGGPGRVGDTVVLLGGEVFVGTIAAETVQLRLPGGKAVGIPLETIDRIGMRQRGEAEESYQSTSDRAILRQGDRLEGKILGDAFQMATAFGTVSVPRNKVARLDLRAEDGVHEIVLADGSTLSGILLDETVSFRHRSGQELSLTQKQVISLEVPGLLLEPAVEPGSPVLTLSNGDRWYARPTAGSLPVETSFGELALKLDEIAAIRFDQPIAGAVSIKLRDGGSFVGKLGTSELTLRLGCGMELTVDAAFLGELRISQVRRGSSRSPGTLPIQLR